MPHHPVNLSTKCRQNRSSSVKKPSLDQDVLQSYRPVSNLPQLSEIIDKVVAQRLSDHLNAQNMNEPFQSANRKLYSIEIALLKVSSNVRVGLDRKEGTLHVLLNLSSAFDTNDHNILRNRLCKRYGLQGCALQWMESHMRDRKQRVGVGQTISGHHSLDTGVPRDLSRGLYFFHCASNQLPRSLGSTA